MHSSLTDGFNADEFWAYDTVKHVRVLDRRLGLVYLVFIIVILIYVTGYVLLISRKFAVEEKVQGWVVMSVRKPQFSEDGVRWDLFDRWKNPGEKGAILIPTHVLVTRGQTQEDEYCESPLHLCQAPEDCGTNELVQKAECVNGHCLRLQWCPAQDPDSATTENYYFEFDQVEVRFQTYTHFHKFKMFTATSDETDWIVYPDEAANTFRVRDLVQWTGVEPSNLTENGAFMMVNLIMDSPISWGMDRTVSQHLESHNIDTVTGYNFVHNEYYYVDGVRKRDTFRIFGLRIVGFATGYAEMISMSGIGLQIASACALMGFAAVFTDFVLSCCLPERKHYVAYKVKVTEDFNEEDDAASPMASREQFGRSSH